MNVATVTAQRNWSKSKKQVIAICDHAMIAIIAVLFADTIFNSLSLVLRIEMISAVPFILWLSFKLKGIKPKTNNS